MVEQSNKRKKHHDKDKYYKLAKEQGFRSRAAFKLIQINRKYHFLENAHLVLDLCAAPGGWTQVASRTMLAARQGQSPNTTNSQNLILAVDILPIRFVGPNVITLIGDITTDKTKSLIKQQLQSKTSSSSSSSGVDVVLCDGAPNVGASYDRDAYMQNEIALHALKCATQHLRKDGTFVTKMYRSADYNAYLWVMKHFFQQVQVVKPTASRSQSAEIFLIGLNYLHPQSIDPQMFDPKCVFEQVDGAATGGGDSTQQSPHSQGGMAGSVMTNIFHKKFDEKRRSRQGYDMDTYDFAMRKLGSVMDFIHLVHYGDGENGQEQHDKQNKKKMMDPIHMLGSCTGLSFTCSSCSNNHLLSSTTSATANAAAATTTTSSSSSHHPTCHCKFIMEHKLTTSEIKTCLMDLKVLNKSDFKALLTWRSKMQDVLKQHVDELAKNCSLVSHEEEEGVEENEDDSHENNEDDSSRDSEDEDQIQADIAMLRQKKLRQQKKLKRKERELMAKRRKRVASGMDTIDLPDNDKIFSLATITSTGQLELAREVDLSKVADDEIFGFENDQEEEDEEETPAISSSDHVPDGEEVDEDKNDGEGYSYRLDKELDDAYDRYLASTKNREATKGTQMAKRSKKVMRQKLTMEAHEDAEMIATRTDLMDKDTMAYAKLLQGNRDSDDSDSESKEDQYSDEDGFEVDPVTPEQHIHLVEKKKKYAAPSEQDSKNPLLFKLPEESLSSKSARWFSNPIFEKINSVAAVAAENPKKDTLQENNDFISDDDDNEVEEAKSSRNRKKPKIKESSDDESGDLTADRILALMPKTDKQIRHEKRVKSIERKERRAAKRSSLNGENAVDFQVVGTRGEDHTSQIARTDGVVDAKEKEVRDLIKAGFGKDYVHAGEENPGFEVVAAQLPVHDERKYDSDNEHYDSDDYATTLALGTMMLRKSKAKALVDASYNRYAWNDPEGLPDWFIDDEKRHYRPQLPIPSELLAKMKQKFLNLAAKPIAKVAEARARKQKRMKTKIAAAKKKAAAVANSTDMTETMKLKAISKAMRGQDTTAPKKYVVSRKNGTAKGGKGIKRVDKRMKSDKRGMDRRAAKGKKRSAKHSRR